MSRAEASIPARLTARQPAAAGLFRGAAVWSATNSPPRIGEVNPIPVTRPIAPRRDPGKRSPRDQRETPAAPRKVPPADGHIIDEYAGPAS